MGVPIEACNKMPSSTEVIHDLKVAAARGKHLHHGEAAMQTQGASRCTEQVHALVFVQLNLLADTQISL
jgi:hypothetical protein